MRKVMVSGANGYIGRHIIDDLRSRNDDIEILAVDFKKDGLPEDVTFSDYPLFNGDPDIYEKFGRPDVLIHLAWRDGFVHNSKAHMEDLSKHVIFLNHMMDGGLPKLSVMGSMHEVGYWEGAIEAETPCNPMSQYGIAKNALRQSLMLYAKDKTTSLRWLRAYYIYGDDARGSSIFSKLQRAAQEGKKSFPFTSGKNLYDFISVKTLAKYIVSASLQNTEEGVINVCTGQPRSLADQVEEYIRMNHLDIRLEYGVYPDRPYDSPGVWGDATIIKRIIAAEK